MDASVVIPTWKRPAKIAACVGRLARQSLEGARYEVLVGLDGPDEAARAAAESAWRDAGGREGHLRVVACEKRGLAATRNRVLEGARGRVLVSMNDDVLAEEGFLEAHAAEHARARDAGRRVIVSGSSPWLIHDPDRLFDRLVRETSMVFFYDGMDDPGARDADRDWGFRHAWGLNMSMDLEDVRRLGGFAVYPATYGYEDNEIAYRLRQERDTPVVYRPRARAWHDHRMGAWEYLEREYKLGYAAWGVARKTPAFAREVFRRDVASAEEVAYARAFVERERRAAGAILASFLALEERPARELDGDGGAKLRRLLYEHHLPLKRWCWRKGLLDAAEAREAGPAAVRGLAGEVQAAS